MKEKINYLGYILFHPFDGFYEAKHRGKGSVKIAWVFIALYCLLQCVKYQYTGFIMNYNPIFYMNSFTILISSLSVLLLFTVANWTITTLFEGKGSLSEILMILGYALVPLILSDFLGIVISNFIIAEEVILLQSLQGVAVAWFVFLITSGLCVIHEYRLFQNLVTIIATAVSAIIIIFLFILLISLMEQMVGFFITIIEESIRRF